MIKASSLFYAIVISLIIAIVSSSLILFAYLSRIEFDNFEMNQRIYLNAESGLNLLLSQQSLIEVNQEKTIDLYGKGDDSVFLSRKSWGAYEIVISKAVFKKLEAIRIAQIGYYPDSSGMYSLYLTDNDKPLALCGKTIIKGTAFISKAGLKRAYIEGQSFVGNTLIDGQIRQSKTTLPEFNKDLISNIQLMFSQKSITENDSVIIIEKDLSGDSLSNSFKNRTLVLTSPNSIRISNGVYEGNIAIISDKQITVSATAVLKDVIIAAPRIIFEKEFKGNLQAFASDSIIVEKEVSLYYPSVLAIVKGGKLPDISAIVLGENDTIMGNVFAYKSDADPLKQIIIRMNDKSVIIGQVYSNGYMDVKGEIKGSIMCDKIILNTPSSVYENHLLNAVIDPSALSRHYVGINLVEESTMKKIVKWLN